MPRTDDHLNPKQLNDWWDRVKPLIIENEPVLETITAMEDMLRNLTHSMPGFLTSHNISNPDTVNGLESGFRELLEEQIYMEKLEFYRAFVNPEDINPEPFTESRTANMALRDLIRAVEGPFRYARFTLKVVKVPGGQRFQIFAGGNTLVLSTTNALNIFKFLDQNVK